MIIKNNILIFDYYKNINFNILIIVKIYYILILDNY